jgi:lycopene cyclase domain-containing protein
MTYLVFHLVFILPPILALGLTLPRPLAGTGGRRAQWAIPLMCLIAFSYTTPWDNYLVANEVWWYGPDRVLATIGYVPVEEYAFFLLQPVLTGLFLYHVLVRWPRLAAAPSEGGTSGGVHAGHVGVAAALGLTGAGVWLLTSGWAHGLYMGLILAWAAPIFVILWGFDGRRLWAMRRVVALAAGLPTLYLWIADWTAITLGIWTIGDATSFGVDPFGLPVEEMTFFLVTNLMVVKGILLFLFGDHRFGEHVGLRTHAAPREAATHKAATREAAGHDVRTPHAVQARRGA